MQPITVDMVNDFLPKDKWQMEADDLDTELVNYYQEQVLGRLSADDYPVADWRAGEAPQLVVSIISQMVAGALYARQFSEATEDRNTYSNFLMSQALGILNALSDGSMTLGDAEKVAFRASDLIDESDPQFDMGMVF